MPTLESFPYLTPAPHLVQVEDWYVGNDGHEHVLPQLLKDWDPLTDLTLSRTVSLDLDAIFEQCGLSKGAEIQVTACWLSSGTKLKERVAASIYEFGRKYPPVNFHFQITGTKLAGSITLLTRILLKKKGRQDSRLAASRIGSILWQDEHATRLEGFGARFPMEFADFLEHGYPSLAGWRLYWKKDFNSQVMGSVWLLINRQHERLRGIVSGAIQDPQSPAILETIHYSVARELIIGGLENEEFVDETQTFPKGSIGEAIFLLMRRVFDNETPDAVRQLYQNEPDRFDCKLQDRLHLFQNSLK